MRTLGIGALMLAVVSAVSAMPAGSAGAAPAVERESVEAASSYDSAAMKGVTARCPDGTVAVGAGAVIDGADGEAVLQAVYPEPSSPLGPPDKAVAIAVETPGGTGAKWRLRVFATCVGVASSAVSWVKATSAVNSTSPKTVTATCPRDRVLVGTGAAVFSGGGAAILSDLVPDPALTSVRADAFENPGYAGSWDVSAYAVCVDLGVFDGLSLVASPWDLSGFVYADCPANALVLAGGASLVGGVLLRTAAFYSAVVPGSFGVGVQPELGRFQAPWYSRAYAICATNLKL